MSDSEDDLCIPKSRSTVKQDLSKHLPPRLSLSSQDDDAKPEQCRASGNGEHNHAVSESVELSLQLSDAAVAACSAAASHLSIRQPTHACSCEYSLSCAAAFDAFKFKCTGSGGGSGGMARAPLEGLTTGLGAAPVSPAAQRKAQRPAQRPAQQPARDQDAERAPDGSSKDSLTAADVPAQPDSLEGASSPVVGKRRFRPAAGREANGQPHATKVSKFTHLHGLCKSLANRVAFCRLVTHSRRGFV